MGSKVLLLLAILSTILVQITVSKAPCAKRDYGRGSVVCVCDTTYCDDFEPLSIRKANRIDIFESNKAGLRFEKTSQNLGESESKFNTWPSPAINLNIDRNITYQDIIGFGGAFTDASGINILSLDSKLSDLIIDNYYSKNGLEYSLGRIPLASTDFSTHKYTYADESNDFELKKFKLTDEDTIFKIPLVQRAMKVTPSPIKFFASAWSAPAWMKTNNDLAGQGGLQGNPGGKYYKTWAKYYVKFLDAYKKAGISMWGMTTGNEPLNGFIKNFSFNCMAFSPETQRDFLKLDLGPILSAAGYGPDKLKIMIMDEQRIVLPEWASVVLEDKEASQYVAGIGFHWYLNMFAPPQLLDLTHRQHPEKFILATEACEGSFSYQREKVILGSWDRAESYSKDIIEDLLHWTGGWTDWNLALDLQGGPNWANNFVDSPIIVNKTANEFYKQPMFYALGHFSKFLKPGSLRVSITNAFENCILDCAARLHATAFITPDDRLVVIILNENSYSVKMSLTDSIIGRLFRTLSPNSLTTFIN